MHLDIGIMFTSTAFRPPSSAGPTPGTARARTPIPQDGIGKTAATTNGDALGGVTTGGIISTNVIDLGDTGTVVYLGAPGGTGVKLRRRMGMIENMPMTVVVLQAIAGGAVTLELIEADNAAATSGVNILVADTLPANTGEDYLWPYQIVPRPIRKRYLAMRYKGPASVTAGRIEAGIVGGVDGAYRG